MNSDRKPTVLIVEDQKMNRQILRQILGAEYEVLEAGNGEEAFDVLHGREGVSAILLDLMMPVMDGYTFLERIKGTPYASLPIIAVTGERDADTEQKVLNLGAWDFVSKPYQTSVLLLRLKNVIIRSQFYLLSEMQHAYEHDALTDLFNRAKFFSETKLLLERYTDRKFALLRFDIDHFHLLNSFWGEEEGDRFLRYAADLLRRVGHEVEPCTYARISADTFCLCESFDESRIAAQVNEIHEALTAYNRNYLIKPSFGVYVIEDPQERIQSMYERATLAAKECKSRYMTFLTYYVPEMSRKVLQEQEIVNEMQEAMDCEQFQVYLQPKYSLSSEQPYGAEALVRWLHPTKGLLSPGMFIPVFERNGFIVDIDFYMWEHVCRLLRKWMDEGLNPAPVSVNVSRVNMYNPNLVNLIAGLVKKYRIPPSLLSLELTESAYMENPDAMGKTVEALQDAGFTIMMDDFGSGYSSLNNLKDIPIDVLKIDMKFLSGGGSAGRKECIMASVVDMAGWLGIPVIMEGVETRSQVEFLRSIGCDYAQGYYYARPMPVADYEALIRSASQRPSASLHENHEQIAQTLWSGDQAIELLFNSIRQPAAIYSFESDEYRILRVNELYHQTFGYGERPDEHTLYSTCGLKGDGCDRLKEAFASAAVTRKESVCTCLLPTADGTDKLIKLDLQYWGENKNAAVLFALFTEPDGADASSTN